jgi:predicted DNA-binding protein (MmcQ/YjbR family)
VSPAEFERLALKLPGATVNVQWANDRVFKVAGKMFAVLGEADPGVVTATFKCTDIAFEMLLERGGVRPAPYLARAKWVQLETLKSLPDAEIDAYLTASYRLVVAKLPKKDRPN